MEEKFKDIISSISKEKNIKEEIVINSLQEITLNQAARKYGYRDKLNMHLNENGSCDIYIDREIIPDNEDNRSFFTISLKNAQKIDPNAKLGDFIKEILPFKLDITKQQEILKELRISLKKHQKTQEFNTFYDKIGTILMGCVKNIDSTEAIVSFTDHIGEVGVGTLKRNKMIKTDSIKYNSYIKVYVEDVRTNAEHQIILSRTHPNFLKELLKAEIPEIAEGLIEIKSIARDSGSLSKVAIHTTRLSLNPIKICIGDRGIRVQNIIKELSGEKISFVLWKETPQEFIASALSTANVLRITEIAPDRYDVVVANEDFSKALGRGGQNVYLTKTLCGVKSINLLTDSEERTKYQSLLEKQTKSLTNNLYIEEMMAHLLISENFDTAEVIANSDESEIAKLEGFDEEIAKILIERSKQFLEKERKDLIDKFKKEKNISDLSLFEIKSLSNNFIKILLENNIISAKDIAVLDIFELINLFESVQITLNENLASKIIMEARKIK